MDRRYRVLLTRQPAQSGDLESGLRAAGHEVGFLPLTDFEVPADSGRLEEAVVRLVAGEYAWLVVTSPNAVRALTRSGWDGALPGPTRVAVTGPGTARVLAAAGCPVNPWMPDGDASAAGIIAAFPSAGEPATVPAAEVPGAEVSGTEVSASSDRRVLLPQSALATAEVAEALGARGWTVDRVEAYRTVPYPAAAERRLLAAGSDSVGAEGASRGTRSHPPSGAPARAGALALSGAPGPSGAAVPPGDDARGPAVGLDDLSGSVVLLTSPSAVRELVSRLTAPQPQGTAFIAIGRPTQRAARDSGLSLAGTASSPDAAGVLEVLAGLHPEGP